MSDADLLAGAEAMLPSPQQHHASTAVPRTLAELEAAASANNAYTLNGGYMLMPEGSRYRNTYMAELSVTLPWLNRGRHDAEIARGDFRGPTNSSPPAVADWNYGV